MDADLLPHVANYEARVRLQGVRIPHRHDEAVQAVVGSVRGDQLRERNRVGAGFTCQCRITTVNH